MKRIMFYSLQNMSMFNTPFTVMLKQNVSKWCQSFWQKYSTKLNQRWGVQVLTEFTGFFNGKKRYIGLSDDSRAGFETYNVWTFPYYIIHYVFF